MKRLNFWMVALTLFMGISLTSCLSTDDDNGTGYDQAHFALVKSMMGSVYFEDGAGTMYIPSMASVAQLEANSSAKISDYQFGMIAYSWVGEKPDYNNLKDSYNVNLMSFLPGKLGYGMDAGKEDDLPKETHPIMTLNVNGTKPFQFSETVICLPIAYYMENKAEARNKHTFVLASTLEEEAANSNQLVFYLRHQTEDTKTEAYDILYHAFDINMQLAEYRVKNGGKNPRQIVIKAHESGQNNTTMPTYYMEYSIEYQTLEK